MAGFSLFVLAATVTGWVRGYWIHDSLFIQAPVFDYRIQSFGGMIQFRAANLSDNSHKYDRTGYGVSREFMLPLRVLMLPYFECDRYPGYSMAEIRFHFMGFYYQQGPRGNPSTILERFYSVYLPDWFICIISLVFPVQSLRRCCLYRHRGKNNRCLFCGYDLRASPICCPECGKAVGPSRQKLGHQ